MNHTLSVSLMIIANLIRTILGQYTGFDCCSLNMMDSRGQVAIETRRQLKSGTFLALRVRACTTDPVAVQIWRLAGNATFNFRWQTVITPVLSTTTQTFLTVNLSPGLVLTSDDRLGVFGPSENDTILSIPFGFDEDSYYLYYSSTVFDSFSDFTSSLQVTTDDLRWPRSFNRSISFCQQADCSDLTSQPPIMTTSPYTPRSGPTISNQCCPNPMSCDPSAIDVPLTNQTQVIRNLQQQVNDITSIIRDLLSSRVVTGLCPQGFTAGSYGVGKCFLLIRDATPMASAALRCQTEYSSLLLQIKSIVEEQFLRTFLSSIATSGVVSFWTAGMFNTDVSTWFWYDDNLRVKSPMVYTNWVNYVTPVPSTDADVCMKLVVAQGTSNSSHWMKADCNENNFFICQVLKTCL